MCLEVAPITVDCRTVTGGLVDAIYIAHKKDVAAIPAPASDTGAITGDVTMTAGKTFASWAFVEDTGSMKEESVGDAGFRSVKTTVSSMVKGNKAQVTRMLNQLLNGSFVLIVKDAEGQTWLIGNKERGATLGIKRDFGTKGEDKNHCALEFTITSGGAMPYNGAIPGASATPTPAPAG